MTSFILAFWSSYGDGITITVTLACIISIIADLKNHSRQHHRKG